MKNFAIGLVLVSCVIAMFGCNNDNTPTTSGGAAPTIVSVTPSSVSLGQKHGEGVIAGTNFNGVTSVVLGAGIAVDSYTAQNANEIAFTFTVAGNVSAGPISVTVITAGGTATSNNLLQVINNHAPQASFKMDPPSGSLSTQITFDATATNDKENNGLSFNWNLGDGASAKGKVVTHKYSRTGTFQVELTVSDSQAATGVSSREIDIQKNGAPQARLDVSPDNGSTGTTFEFDGSRSSDPEGKKIQEYLFDFGDGKKSRGSKSVVEHAYEKEGNYDASLTVFDNLNQASVPQVERIHVEKGPKETACAGSGHAHQSIIKGRVVAVEAGQWAIVDFGAGHSCANVWHKCDDFRRLNPEGFYGIVDKMTDRGNGVLAVHNSCPYRWPPSVGEQVFIYYKTCSINHCP